MVKAKNKNKKASEELSRSKWFYTALKYLPEFLFVALWAFLSVYESAFLYRVSELSVFLFDGLFFEGMMSKPAGLLYYAASFFVQFFHYPALGAAIYVAMLYAVYRLVAKVFELPQAYRPLAFIPVVLLLASNTQLGYWIFYLKQPGYYYMALLATLVFLLALWLYKKINEPLRILFVVLIGFVGYPLFGAYALVMALLMGIFSVAQAACCKRGLALSLATLVAAVVSACASPQVWYYSYTSICREFLYGAAFPITQWITAYVDKVEHDVPSYWHNVFIYWIPFILLLLSFLGLSLLFAMRNKLGRSDRRAAFVVPVVVLLFSVLVLWVFWYNDNNFRIENKQNKAMWNEQWRDVARYAKEADVPTRQVVLNKNIALHKLGTACAEAFAYPDGSSDILAPMSVHLSQTGGKMAYFQYGKFNFCYRWCVEDAVEYGWRVEYLKHAVRSMLLAGEYRLAQRYVDILKRTLFYRGWAGEMERFIKNPELIEKERDFYMPLQLVDYPDNLDNDESFVEAYLTKNFKFIPDGATPLYLEVALLSTMIRKDSKAFWYILERYLNECKPERLPKNCQEAVLLFLNLDKGQNVTVPPGFVDRFVSKGVQRRLESFVAKTKRYKGMKEAEMAPYFKDDYSDTYFYFYFFVRKIRTN